MSRLYDISFFTFGFLDKDKELRKICNYVADTYHNYLDGYKPPKTTRIGIFLTEKLLWSGKPSRDGSLMHLSGVFDENKYRSLDGKKAMRYLLDILHWTITGHCEELAWDAKVFEKAYDKVIDSNFKFIRGFEKKTSRNKLNHGQVVLKKTIDTTNIHFVLNDHDIKVYSNENRYWLDPWYNIKSSCKWFDNNRFGVHFADGQFRFYYSLDKRQLGYEIIPKDKSKNELEEKYKRLIGHVHASY